MKPEDYPNGKPELTCKVCARQCELEDMVFRWNAHYNEAYIQKTCVHCDRVQSRQRSAKRIAARRGLDEEQTQKLMERYA